MQYLSLIASRIMYYENVVLTAYDFRWIKQPSAEGKDVFEPITELVCSIGAVVFAVGILCGGILAFWIWKKIKRNSRTNAKKYFKVVEKNCFKV